MSPKPRFDWTRFLAAKDREIARLESLYRQNLKNAGVTVFDSRAILADAHSVELADGQRVPPITF